MRRVSCKQPDDRGVWRLPGKREINLLAHSIAGLFSRFFLCPVQPLPWHPQQPPVVGTGRPMGSGLVYRHCVSLKPRGLAFPPGILGNILAGLTLLLDLFSTSYSLRLSYSDLHKNLLLYKFFLYRWPLSASCSWARRLTSLKPEIGNPFLYSCAWYVSCLNWSEKREEDSFLGSLGPCHCHHPKTLTNNLILLGPVGLMLTFWPAF